MELHYELHVEWMKFASRVYIIFYYLNWEMHYLLWILVHYYWALIYVT